MPYSKNMADYRRNKAKMIQSKKERNNIPQVILPEYKGTGAAGQAAG